MLTYALDKTAGVSLYEQLYRRVKEDILSGRLAAGEKLPSKRALAAHLEVSVIGWLLGPWYGGAAAGIGSMLTDLLSGYGYYAPGTFVIKGLDALVAALIFKAMGRTSVAAIVSGLVGEIIMVVGYFGYAALLLGKGIGAAASIPGNLVQAAMGLVIGFVLLKVMQKTRIAEKI